MKYRLNKNVMTGEKSRAAYNALATKTFGISFEQWYQDGFWRQSHTPYTLFDGELAIANISVNQMNIEYQGKGRSYIQLGGVMTEEAYRNQGLSRYLMEQVLADWMEEVDAIFLLANRNVVDFYPKFGFCLEKQYTYEMKVTKEMQDFRQSNLHVEGNVKKLDMKNAADVALLREYYGKKNPYSKLQAVNGFSLLMFYCGSYFKDFIYYIPETDAVVIAEKDGNTLQCYDVYCDEKQMMQAGQQLLAPLLQGIEKIQFCFTPKDTSGMQEKEIDDPDDNLFVFSSKENIFAGDKLMIPEISHT